jgi:hypothetical protein
VQLKSITYTSLAALDLGTEDLAAIHQTARHFNALDGITGLLVFDGKRFLQIVEGSDEAVDSLIARLRSDPRHSAIEVRDERHVDRRSFPDWSMELVEVSAGYLSARPEIDTILPEPVTDEVRGLLHRMTARLAQPVQMPG